MRRSFEQPRAGPSIGEPLASLLEPTAYSVNTVLESSLVADSSTVELNPSFDVQSLAANRHQAVVFRTPPEYCQAVGGRIRSVIALWGMRLSSIRVDGSRCDLGVVRVVHLSRTFGHRAGGIR